MAFAEDGEAKAIAASWGVDVSLFDDIEWEVDTIDGNDGEVYGYIVRFNDETDREVLTKLGVEPGETTRRLSLNAFDGPDYTDEDYDRDLIIREGVEDETPSSNDEDDGTSPIDRPFPDISAVIDDFEISEPLERTDDGQRSYYLEDRRIFPSEFRELDRGLKIEAMVQWFHENYEDPAVRTPYESAEGGYQWIWGGPYDAREEIGDQFSDIADDDEIEAAVQEVEKDGPVDWAPKESPDDYDQPDEVGDEPPPAESLAAIMGSNFGNSNFSNFTFEPGVVANTFSQDGAVEALKSEMLDRLDGLEALIRQQMAIAPNRGHNHPPELLELDPPVTQAQFQELVVAISEIRQESESTSPQLANVVEKVSLFRRIADFIRTGPGLVIGAAVSGVIGDVAADAFKAHQHQIYESLVHAADAVMAWVNYLLPF
jgi:hypothetical protein